MQNETMNEEDELTDEQEDNTLTDEQIKDVLFRLDLAQAQVSTLSSQLAEATSKRDAYKFALDIHTKNAAYWQTRYEGMEAALYVVLKFIQGK